MGNYVSSSACLILTRPARPKTAKLVDSKGDTKQVKLPARAGEIMLDEPGHAVSSVHELKRTGRVVAMRADDEVVAGEVYLLVPLGRVNGRVTEREKTVLLAEYSNGDKRSRTKRRGSAKVLPEAGGVDIEMADEVLEVGDHMGGIMGSSSSSSYVPLRKGNHRPWLPVLDTISEEEL